MAELINTSLFTDANLEAYYRFETGALTTDSSGDSETLTNTNSVGEATGKYGIAADFGTGDHNKDMRRSSNYGLTGVQDMSFAFWVKLNTEISANSYHIFGLETTLTTARYLFFDYEYNGGTRRLNANVAGTSTTYNITLGTSNWYHMVYVRSSNTPSIWVNGVSVVSGTAGTGTSGDNRLFMGRNTAGNNDAAIILDDFGIFSKALSTSEIQELYNPLFLGGPIIF